MYILKTLEKFVMRMPFDSSVEVQLWIMGS
jgi:hypothetical protein